MGMTHSEGLMPQLEQLLTRTKITKNEIDLLAVSMGPGSFTGLRIGLASAEAMAYSWHKPICGVNTLKALAYNLPIDAVSSIDEKSFFDVWSPSFRRTKRQFLSGDL